MTIKAIETRYAGCRFRSRLEARWAVFFDTLGIRWEYEPEGFELPSGRYLPDFWFPDHRLYGEVKGDLSTPGDLDRLLANAYSLSTAGRFDCGTGDGHDLVVFGRLPRPVPGMGFSHPVFGDAMPTRLHVCGGTELQGTAWWGENNELHPAEGDLIQSNSGWGSVVGTWLRSMQNRGRAWDGRAFNTPEDVIAYWLLDGSWSCYGNHPVWLVDETGNDASVEVGLRFSKGYEAARSARFEHGERG